MDTWLLQTPENSLFPSVLEMDDVQWGEMAPLSLAGPMRAARHRGRRERERERERERGEGGGLCSLARYEHALTVHRKSRQRGATSVN